MRQYNITLNETQVQFIKDNYKEMTKAKMARSLHVSVGRIDSHMTLLKLKKKKWGRGKAKVVVMDGFYNEKDYKQTMGFYGW